jgi:hypothetical protein
MGYEIGQRVYVYDDPIAGHEIYRIVEFLPSAMGPSSAQHWARLRSLENPERECVRPVSDLREWLPEMAFDVERELDTSSRI